MTPPCWIGDRGTWPRTRHRRPRTKCVLVKVWRSTATIRKWHWISVSTGEPLTVETWHFMDYAGHPRKDDRTTTTNRTHPWPDGPLSIRDGTCTPWRIYVEENGMPWLYGHDHGKVFAPLPVLVVGCNDAHRRQQQQQRLRVFVEPRGIKKKHKECLSHYMWLYLFIWWTT